MTELRPASLLEEAVLADRRVPRAELLEWEQRFGLKAGITLRGQGFSLGLWSEEPAGAVLARWRAFQDAGRPAFRRFAVGQQVHGTEVAWHGDGDEGWLILDGVDGHLTGQTGLLLCVTVADCVPVYLVHPPSGTLGLLHAGWRGVAAGLLERTADLLRRRVGAEPRDLTLHCGVAICGDCYQVGPEVIRAVTGGESAGPEKLDLRAAIAARANRLGVGDLTMSEWCSAHDEAFFSHRRSRGADGRMVAYLGRPLA